jgi:hypothetical protein
MIENIMLSTEIANYERRDWGIGGLKDKNNFFKLNDEV